jgi:hypothetical protein
MVRTLPKLKRKFTGELLEQFAAANQGINWPLGFLQLKTVHPNESGAPHFVLFLTIPNSKRNQRQTARTICCRKTEDQSL